MTNVLGLFSRLLHLVTHPPLRRPASRKTLPRTKGQPRGRVPVVDRNATTIIRCEREE
jgi:hypothetical protein